MEQVIHSNVQDTANLNLQQLSWKIQMYLKVIAAGALWRLWGFRIGSMVTFQVKNNKKMIKEYITCSGK